MQGFFAPRKRNISAIAGGQPESNREPAQLGNQQLGQEKDQQPEQLHKQHHAAAGEVCTGHTPLTTHSQPTVLAMKRASNSKGFPQGQPGLFRLPGDGDAVIGYWPRHFKNADAIYKELLETIPWQQHKVVVFGQQHDQPRLIAYYSLDTSKTYTYSGLQLQPLEFTPLLHRLRMAVQELCGGEEFNTVLLNLYRDGKDCMGWHSDDEAVYAAKTTIASLSFGTEREFLLRSKADHGLGVKFSLGAGDALVMCGTTQLGWQHSVPKRAPPNKYAPRINLTFRRALLTGATGGKLKRVKL